MKYSIRLKDKDRDVLSIFGLGTEPYAVFTGDDGFIEFGTDNENLFMKWEAQAKTAGVSYEITSRI